MFLKLLELVCGIDIDVFGDLLWEGERALILIFGVGWGGLAWTIAVC